MPAEVCVAWTPIYTCDLTAISPVVTGQALRAAVEVLDSLTGHRFGGCQLSIRPCRRSCYGESWTSLSQLWWEYGSWPRPLFYNGVWMNVTCGTCQGGCACTPLSEVWLPNNVTSVDQVKVDGVVLSPTAYRLDNFRVLTRIDGGVWPLCNELNRADTEVGTWSVTATYGEPVPTLGQLAVGELMCELVNLLTGNKACSLPTPIQTLVRQGVTMNFIDPNTVFDHGRVGLYLSDLFIQTYNPNALQAAAQVFDVDNMSSFRITGTA